MLHGFTRQTNNPIGNHCQKKKAAAALKSVGKSQVTATLHNLQLLNLVDRKGNSDAGNVGQSSHTLIKLAQPGMQQHANRISRNRVCPQASGLANSETDPNGLNAFK